MSSKAKILIVEDEAIVARDIQNCLLNLGYGVIGTVSNGEEAIAQARRRHPDLILMDITLKGDLDGIETALKIRAQMHVPVVYLTAHTDEQTLLAAKASDAYGYIVKPFEEYDLKSAIEVALYRHQTDQKLALIRHQLEVANAELEAFSYTVSHDLRAPLRAIDGFSRLMMEPDIYNCLPEEGRHCLAMILRGGKEMAQLIEDLLMFSRIAQAGMRYSSVDMKALCGEVIDKLALGLGNRSIHWKLGELSKVDGDRNLLKLVWQNMIANAVKFTRSKAIAEIAIGSEESSKNIVYFVKDNGVGFDMRYISKLFGVFQRLHSSDEFEGTGIGLANVRRIICRHNGHCWAESKKDQGASFYFSLPKEKSKEETFPRLLLHGGFQLAL